jgi:hypothetical protein
VPAVLVPSNAGMSWPDPMSAEARAGIQSGWQHRVATSSAFISWHKIVGPHKTWDIGVHQGRRLAGLASQDTEPLKQHAGASPFLRSTECQPPLRWYHLTFAWSLRCM